MLIDARLTGFLVTYSPGHKSNTIERNPGNAYVDVYAATLYSEPELLGAVSGSGCLNYSWYVKTGKPIGFAEYSCRDGGAVGVPVPSPGLLVYPAAKHHGKLVPHQLGKRLGG